MVVFKQAVVVPEVMGNIWKVEPYRANGDTILRHLETPAEALRWGFLVLFGPRADVLYFKPMHGDLLRWEARQPMSVPIRVMATAAVWAVAVVVGSRLRHTVVWAALVALALSLTTLIWSDSAKK